MMTLTSGEVFPKLQTVTFRKEEVNPTCKSEVKKKVLVRGDPARGEHTEPALGRQGLLGQISYRHERALLLKWSCLAGSSASGWAEKKRKARSRGLLEVFLALEKKRSQYVHARAVVRICKTSGTHMYSRIADHAGPFRLIV